MQRPQIEAYFRQVAHQDNLKLQGFNLEEWLEKDDKGRRILLVMPESTGDVFMVTSLFENIKKVYPTYNLYVATKPEYFEVLNCNPYVTRVLRYLPMMDSLVWLEGQWNHPGFFEIAFLPFVGTQRFLDYLHGSGDHIQFDINSRMVKWEPKEKHALS